MARIAGEHPGPISRIPGPDRVGGPSARVPTGPMATSETFGAGKFNDLYKLGVAGQNFFNTTMKISIDRDHQRQSVEATDQILAYQRASAEKLAELEQKAGTSGFDVDKEFDEWDKANRPLYGESVNSGLAGKLFKEHTDKLYTTGMGRMTVHKARQSKVAEYDTADKVKQSYIEEVKRDWRSFSKNIDNMAVAVFNEAKIKGLTKESAKFNLDKAMYDLAENAVNAALLDSSMGYGGAWELLKSKDGDRILEILGDSKLAELLGSKKQNLYAHKEEQAKTAAIMKLDDYARTLSKNTDVTGDDYTSMLFDFATMHNLWDHITHTDLANTAGRVGTQRANFDILTEQNRVKLINNSADELAYGVNRPTISDLTIQANSEDKMTRDIARATLDRISKADEIVTNAQKLQGEQAVNAFLRFEDNEAQFNAMLMSGDIDKASKFLRDGLSDVWDTPGVYAAYNAKVDWAKGMFGDRARDAQIEKANKDMEREEKNRARSNAKEAQAAIDEAKQIFEKYNRDHDQAINSPELADMMSVAVTRDKAMFIQEYLYKSRDVEESRITDQQNRRYAEYRRYDMTNPSAGFAPMLETDIGRLHLLNEVGLENYGKLVSVQNARHSGDEKYKFEGTMFQGIESAIRHSVDPDDSEAKVLADRKVDVARLEFEKAQAHVMRLTDKTSIEQFSPAERNMVHNMTLNAVQAAFGSVKRASEIVPTTERPREFTLEQVQQLFPEAAKNARVPRTFGFTIEDPELRKEAEALLGRLEFENRQMWQGEFGLDTGSNPRTSLYVEFVKWKDSTSTSERLADFLSGTAPLRVIEGGKADDYEGLREGDKKTLAAITGAKTTLTDLNIAQKPVFIVNELNKHVEQTGQSVTDRDVPQGVRDFANSLSVAYEIVLDITDNTYKVKYDVENTPVSTMFDRSGNRLKRQR